MLKIRLQRVGRRHDPAFRVVLVDSHSAAKSGKAIELLGSYHQRDDKPTLKDDRIKHWINTGAQLSPTVHNMLISAGIIEGKKINVLPQKSPVVKEEPTHSTGSGQATDNPQPTTDNEQPSTDDEPVRQAQDKQPATDNEQPPAETEQASEADKATEDAPAEKADDSAAEDTEGKDDEEEKPAEDTPSEAPETSQEEPESSENGELKKS